MLFPFRAAADFFEWEVTFETAAVWAAIASDDARKATNWVAVYWVVN
jgi:hypothetical protein